jgi:hypothetical protein
VVHIVMKESQMKNDTVSFVQKFLDRYHEWNNYCDLPYN